MATFTGATGATDRDTPFVVESYARSISSAVLFIDGDGNWKVGLVGQKVAQYKSVSANATATVNDDTFELTALTAETRDGGGFLVYAQSNADPSSYSEITLDAAGLVTSQRTLTLDQLFAAETKYGLDLNDNGGIGNQLVLADDGEADVYIDGAGAYVVKTPNGQLIPLTLDSQPVTIYSFEDYEFSDVSVEADGSLTSYIEGKSGTVFKMVSSSSGASSTPPQPVSAEELAAREVKTGVDINRDYAKPLTEGWTASLKTASLRHDVEVQLAQSGKIGHAGLVNLLDGVLQNLQSSGATKVGADLVTDLRELGARGQALFTSPDLAGNDTTYLSFVFDQMVNSSKANTTFTGGQAKSQSLGNLSADSAPSQLALLRDKWLLGKDLPKARDALAKADPAALLAALARDGTTTLPLPGGGTATIASDDVLVRTTAKPGWAAAESPRAVVVVASELTSELVAEGLVNEVVHAVQSFRKKLDLEFTERIELAFVTDSADLRQAIEAHRDVVGAETLATGIAFGPLVGAATESVDVDGLALSISILREKVPATKSG